jgi:hypothetical protein
MSAKDKFHEVVKTALAKDQWLVTDDPLTLKFGRADLYVDLGAERMLAAQKGEQKIAVEVKSFIGPSAVSEFHLALGQYRNYQRVLRRTEPERLLYLAVSDDVYNTIFQLELIQLAIEEDEIRLLIFDPAKEEISQWIS